VAWRRARAGHFDTFLDGARDAWAGPHADQGTPVARREADPCV